MELSGLSRRILDDEEAVDLGALHARMRQAAARALDALHRRFPGRPRPALAEAA